MPSPATRNSFFHSHPVDEASTLAGTVADVFAGITLMLAIMVAAFWLMVLA